MPTETVQTSLFESVTPEYQEAYDKALDELNNPVTKSEETQEQEEIKTEDTEGTEAPVADPFQEYKDEMDRRFASTEKALKDTQKWGHSLATKVKELNKQIETATSAQRPALLDKVEGLEDAIIHITKINQTNKVEEDYFPPTINTPPPNTWVETVSMALPDLNNLLNDPELNDRARALQARHESEWDNPVIAIRYLSDLRQDYLTQKAVREAVSATSTKQNETQLRKDGMRVPTGNSKPVGRSGTADFVNDADAVRGLTHEQFLKMRNKTLSN